MLEIVRNANVIEQQPFDYTVAHRHHNDLVEAYLQSHRIRNHAPNTIKKESQFLKKWFNGLRDGDRSLFTWQVMKPHIGRKIILDYGAELLASGLHTKTIRGYLGILQKYFSYVLEFPHVEVFGEIKRIEDIYGVILTQPVSEFDMPHHTFDGVELGVPLDPSMLFAFYKVVRDSYLQTNSKYLPFKARNYTMLVLAGECGFRADELRNIEIADLFFSGKKIQTRSAKGSCGSGKKSRISLFTPFAQDSVRHFQAHHRGKILGKNLSQFLFPTKNLTPVSYSTQQREINLMVKAARKSDFPVLPHMGWHWMRRIFATRFIEQYPDKLAVLVQLLGHSSPNTVHRYIRHSEAWMDKQIIETLEGNYSCQFNGI